MSANHNRIKVADLEKNQQNKVLKTNQNGELEFSDINNLKIDGYNGLDYTAEGKALDARQGKVLKDLIDKVSVLPPDIINDCTENIRPNKSFLDTLYSDVPVGTYIHFTNLPRTSPNFPGTFRKTTFGWILIGFTEIIQ